MTKDPVEARHTSKGPKRMLALDGGGVRGILSLGFLKHIEATLRKRYHDDTFVLSRYFDFIGGTSTGAIIASLLSQGAEVNGVIELYQRLANDIFRKRFWRRGLLFTKFRKNKLAMLNGLTSLQMMLEDAGNFNETLLQWLSSSPTAREIDKEIGTLENDYLCGEPRFHYIRYNTFLNSSWLGRLGITITDKQAKSLSEMDDTGNIELLTTVGDKVGSTQVTNVHFPKFFDVQ